jgi:hypothetical protein
MDLQKITIYQNQLSRANKIYQKILEILANWKM